MGVRGTGGHGGEPTISIKRRELLDQLGKYRLLKNSVIRGHGQ